MKIIIMAQTARMFEHQGIPIQSFIDNGFKIKDGVKTKIQYLIKEENYERQSRS